MDSNDEIVSINIDSSMLIMVKMCFLYSAIMDGWKVEKLSSNKLCFSKKNIKKHFSIDSFMKKHIPTTNINITNIITKN
jgi:hypothetical protein